MEKIMNGSKEQKIQDSEEIEPWDLEDQYYEQWRDEQVAFDNWKSEENQQKAIIKC